MKRIILCLMIMSIVFSACACSLSGSAQKRYSFHLGDGSVESYTFSELDEMATSNGRKLEELRNKQVRGSGTIYSVSGPRETNWDVDPITGEETPIGWEVNIKLDDGMTIIYRPNSPEGISLYSGDEVIFIGEAQRATEILVWNGYDSSHKLEVR